MPNNPRLHTYDEETDKILSGIPKGKRSAYICDAVKSKWINEKNAKNSIPKVKITA